MPIITKNLTVDDYGIWVQMNTSITLIIGLVGLGLPFAMVRFLSAVEDPEKFKEDFYTLTFTILFSGLITSSLIICFSNTISYYLFNGNNMVVIILAVIILITALNNLFLNFFRTINQMKYFSFFLIVQNFLILIITCILVIEKYSIIIISLGLLLSYLITSVIAFLIIFKRIGFKRPNFTSIRKYLDFSIPTIPNDLSFWIADSSDRYLITILLGISFVAYYAPAYALGNIILFFLTPISIVITPNISKNYENDEIDVVKGTLSYSIKYFLLFSIPAAFGLSILSKPLLTLLTTSQIALNGYFVTPFVAFGAIILGIASILDQILVLKNKTKIIGTIWIVTAILNIILNLIFIPYLGIIGAAIMTLISYIATLTLTARYSFKNLKFDFDLSFIVKCISASILMSLLIIFFYPNNLINIILIIILGMIFYFASIIILGGLKEETKYILSYLKSTKI